MSDRPFLGIDGEGAGTDDKGRQLYRFIRAEKKILRADAGETIATVDALEFLLSLPAEPILVGYYFGYDATMILRDLEAGKLRRIFDRSRASHGGGTGPYTWWKEYGIDYVPGQFFRVCRLDRETNKPIKNSCRTVHEVSGFFRGPFVDALATYGIGSPQQIKKIIAGKERRGGEITTKDDERYCLLECQLLAELMERLREACELSGIKPHSWKGAGQLANAMLKKNNMPRAAAINSDVGREHRIDVSHDRHHYPSGADWKKAVMQAYFGGRIECRLIGDIAGPVYQYDIRSAYPAAMLELPCPDHTHWHRFKGAPKGWSWWLGRGRWSRPAKASPLDWGPLPARRKDQSTCYPMSVAGCWWSPELEAIGNFDYEGGWGADRECDCKPWDWIREVFARRDELGPGPGYPIKIGLAALYGKLAQRFGKAEWRDIAMAGLVTSSVRAKLYEAMVRSDVVMVATDAIYSRSPMVHLHTGRELGDWSLEVISSPIHVVGPGIFWSGEEIVRGRGIGRKRILEAAPELQALWRNWYRSAIGSLRPPPSLDLNIEIFVNHRTAISLGQVELAGKWHKIKLPLSYDWKHKRDLDPLFGDGYVITVPKRDHVNSVAYDPKRITDLDKLHELTEAMPDGE